MLNKLIYSKDRLLGQITAGIYTRACVFRWSSQWYIYIYTYILYAWNAALNPKLLISWPSAVCIGWTTASEVDPKPNVLNYCLSTTFFILFKKCCSSNYFRNYLCYLKYISELLKQAAQGKRKENVYCRVQNQLDAQAPASLKIWFTEIIAWIFVCT